MKEKYEFLYSKTMYERVKWTGDNSALVNVHGLSVSMALQFIRNLLCLSMNEPFILEVIHGYNHGTAIKEAIRKESLSRMPYQLVSVPDNQEKKKIVINE